MEAVKIKNPNTSIFLSFCIDPSQKHNNILVLDLVSTCTARGGMPPLLFNLLIPVCKHANVFSLLISRETLYITKGNTKKKN